MAWILQQIISRQDRFITPLRVRQGRKKKYGQIKDALNSLPEKGGSRKH